MTHIDEHSNDMTMYQVALHAHVHAVALDAHVQSIVL
jgi:hypothetical protein